MASATVSGIDGVETGGNTSTDPPEALRPWPTQDITLTVLLHGRTRRETTPTHPTGCLSTVPKPILGTGLSQSPSSAVVTASTVYTSTPPHATTPIPESDPEEVRERTQRVRVAALSKRVMNPKTKICSHEGCTDVARRRGVCIRHGAESRLCSHEGGTAETRGVCTGRSGTSHSADKAVAINEEYETAGISYLADIATAIKAESETADEIAPMQEKRTTRADEYDGPAPKRGRWLNSVADCTNDVKQGGVCWRHEAKDKASLSATDISEKATDDGKEDSSRNDGSVATSTTSYPADRKRITCRHDECTKWAIQGGLCVEHGAKCKICSHQGCNNRVQNGGVCFKHGAKKPPLCSYQGCAKQAKRGGVCIRHGATPYTKKTCSREGCTNQSRKDGVCTRHGTKRRLCSHEGCSNQVKAGGVCGKHGSRKPPLLCSHQGCTKQAKRGGVCIRHGATSNAKKACSHEACTNQARKDGVCTKHGAKRAMSMCNHEGCGNIKVRGGVCWRHGAKITGAKRAMSMCSHEGCGNIKVRGGVCWRHGAKFTSKTCTGRYGAKVKAPAKEPHTVMRDERNIPNKEDSTDVSEKATDDGEWC